MSYKLLLCPLCKSSEVVATVEQLLHVDTGEHHCHSAQSHAEVKCLNCIWKGERCELLEWDQHAV